MDTTYAQYFGRYEGFIAGIVVAVAVLLYFSLKRRRRIRAIIADFQIENEIKGEVEAVLIMPYIPGGWSSMEREEQTEIVFKNGERVRVEELHPEIKKGETWYIKYVGTGKYGLPVLIEKKRKY
ncbi:hypothetical protein KAS79_01185 [Candidatus Parcubacteria bacterium]|nr:hypothetical protein [Candidatus Parcubacteria bacterium]